MQGDLNFCGEASVGVEAAAQGSVRAWVPPIEKGGLRARLAESAEDHAAALALRAARFRAGRADRDPLDALCMHVLVEPAGGGAPVLTFRLLHLRTAREIGLSYAARSYDLGRLARYPAPILEIGRFCARGKLPDAAAVRLAWALLTRYVDGHNIGLMMGCSSFPGCDPAPYRDAFALLSRRHLAPPRWAPRANAPETYGFSRALAGAQPDLRRANREMPSLLRTYLAMGGWVSDHAVIDRDLGTLHVFTAVEVARIPEPRKRLLRADAA